MSSPIGTDLRFGVPPNVQPVYAVTAPNRTDLRFTNPNVQPVYVENANPGVFNVAAYGAVGDGVTDDAPAMQAAIDASAVGDVIYFPQPAVSYNVMTMLRFKSQRTYLGDSNQGYIRMGNGANLPAIAASEEWVNNVNLAGNPTFVFNLGFDGNSANNTTGHGFVLQAWQSVVQRCWFKNIPQTAMVVTDRTSNGTTLVTNSIVENRLYDLKIATTGQYGIWVTDYNGQCTDGRIANCDINTTGSTGMFVERGAGWYIYFNHVYSVKGSGYVVNKCFATWIIGNQVADFGNDVAAVGTFSGLSATLIEGYPTVIADNSLMNREIATGATFNYLVVTCDGALAATSGTFGIVHDNQIRGGWPNASHGLDSIGMVLSATANQQTSGQPAGLMVHNNHFDRIHTESSIGAFIQTNMLLAHTYGPAQVDGQLGVQQLASTGAAVALAAGASAGTTPPAPVSVSSRDLRGQLTFGTGTAPTAGSMVSVTFNKAYASAPIVVVSANNAAAAALQLYASSITANGFNLSCAVAPAASQPNTTYAVSYHIIQ